MYMSFLNNKNIRYIKHNRAILKQGEREKSTKLLLDFLKGIEGKVKGLKGYMVMDNLQYEQESIVLTFWESKEDMDAFYSSNNKDLLHFVEKIKPYFEHMPERTDYLINEFKI